MESVFLVVVIVVALWFFGFVRSIRSVAERANVEVSHQAEAHEVSIAVRRAELAKKINAKVMAGSADLDAKLALLRSAAGGLDGTETDK